MRPHFNLFHRAKPEWEKDLRRERNELKEERSQLYKTIRELRAKLEEAERDYDCHRLRAEVERLQEEIMDERAVCLCGCPSSEHENHGEDGECCENPHHQCVRVCHAAANAVKWERDERWFPLLDSVIGLLEKCPLVGAPADRVRRAIARCQEIRERES